MRVDRATLERYASTGGDVKAKPQDVVVDWLNASQHVVPRGVHRRGRVVHAQGRVFHAWLRVLHGGSTGRQRLRDRTSVRYRPWTGTSFPPIATQAVVMDTRFPSGDHQAVTWREFGGRARSARRPGGPSSCRCARLRIIWRKRGLGAATARAGTSFPPIDTQVVISSEVPVRRSPGGHLAARSRCRTLGEAAVAPRRGISCPPRIIWRKRGPGSRRRHGPGRHFRQLLLRPPWLRPPRTMRMAVRPAGDQVAGRGLTSRPCRGLVNGNRPGSGVGSGGSARAAPVTR